MKLMGHSTVTLSQRYVHPSPEAMENAVTRMEAYNKANTGEVSTKMATATVTVSGLSRRSAIKSIVPGWRNRQTQRT